MSESNQAERNNCTVHTISARTQHSPSRIFLIFNLIQIVTNKNTTTKFPLFSKKFETKKNIWHTQTKTSAAATSTAYRIETNVVKLINKYNCVTPDTQFN